MFPNRASGRLNGRCRSKRLIDNSQKVFEKMQLVIRDSGTCGALLEDWIIFDCYTTMCCCSLGGDADRDCSEMCFSRGRDWCGTARLGLRDLFELHSL